MYYACVQNIFLCRVGNKQSEHHISDFFYLQNKEGKCQLNFGFEKKRKKIVQTCM